MSNRYDETNHTTDTIGKEKVTFTEWANEPTVEKLKGDLTVASPYHDLHMKNVETWLDNLHVRGKAKPTKRENYSSVQPKLIRKQAEWRYASLSEPFLSAEKLFSASPVTAEDRKAAEQNELVLNKQFRGDIDRVLFIDSYVRTAVDEGTAIIRTGWKYETRLVTKEKPIYKYVPSDSSEAAMMLEQLAQDYQKDKILFEQTAPKELQEALRITIETGSLTIPVLDRYEEVEEEEIVHNKPTVEVCNHNNVIIDPSCKGDLSKANFVLYRFPTSIADLKKTGRYKNLDFIHTEDNSVLASPDSTAGEEQSFQYNDESRKLFHAYEYWGNWDINDDQILVPIVATFVGDVMIRCEENPFPDKEPPFVVVPYLPVKESIYGEPDGVLIEDNQKIAGAVTRGMIDILGRSANGQQAIRKDALDPVNRRRYDRGEDYEFNPNVLPDQAFYTHKYPEIPQSAMLMLNLQNMEAESLTGVKAFSGGLSGDALGDVATSVRGVLDAASKRELGILRRLANGIVKVGRKFIAMNSEWLSETEIVRITNEEFVPVRRDDLTGRIDIKLTISTAEEDNAKAGELAFMLQTMGANIAPEMSKLILSEIARLRKMPDLAKTIKEYQPQPDPLAQEIQMLQVQKLKMEIEEIKSRTMENYSEMGVDQAKIANLNSKTDLQNLDFVETESGTKHARDVDKITAQAESQARKSMLETMMGNR